MNRKFSGDKDINLLPKTQLYLFDIYVKPILLYGSEVWSTANYRNRAKNLNDPHTQNIVNDNFIVKIHIDYCKFILGVGRTTSNDAALAELGKHYLNLDIKIKIVKYCYRIISL